MNILVLCTGNSARSILLEHILNHHGAGRVTAYSAGSQPAGEVHPQSLKLLDAHGYDTSAARSKSWDEFAAEDAPEMDVVITVCGSAAEETCPIWPGAPVRAHWGVEDPAAATAADQPKAFADAYDTLRRRAEAFLSLPLDTLSEDRAGLQNALNQIGKLP
ncbi:arsenate reductase ArsC [Aestuariivita boseongensis]|uniref:arsenate reductase ArsC n=1 Tax=Aestuariivita boseongensis TaxID=1470562 RepID=UPI0006805A95|nr:arsenate reductase ArsC [Aestuariivita boseongensis]